MISESEQARLNKDKSIKYWKDVNKIIKVDELGPFHANYQHSGGIQELELVAKGDFDGDQIEDMLLTSRDSVKEGSYSAIRLFMITRTSEASAVMAKEYIY